MIVVPEICATERTPGGVRLRLKIAPEITYFQGHFAQCRVLPGVVQVGWAIELGRTQIPFAGRFAALTAVKFMRVIQPETFLTLTLDYADDKQQLDFAYDLDGRACSSGSILFDS